MSSISNMQKTKLKIAIVAAGASQVSGHFWQGSYFDEISGQNKWFNATMERMGIVARMGFAGKSGGGTSNTDFSQQPGGTPDICDPEANQVLKDGTASSQNIHATVSDDGTFTFHNDGGCGTENGGSGFSVWDGNCGGPAGKSIWGDGSDLNLPSHYAGDGCAVMCGDKKCSELPGTNKPTVWDDLAFSSSTLNPAFSQGLSMCPGFYTWKGGGDGSADGSVCTYNNANLVQDDNNRRKVKAGQKYPAMYSMVANHMGSFTYIMVDARCGDKKECFDTSKSAQNEFKPVVLQFDDDSTLPTFQNRVRIVEPTNNAVYAPLAKEGYLHHPSWSASPSREDGWYFGDEGSPYGAEYIKIPRDTPAGKYTVMLKWETSTEQKIFASCSDIEVESACHVENCATCTKHQSVCTGCLQGYKLDGNTCSKIKCNIVHCNVCANTTSCAPNQCDTGYTGATCSDCADGYHKKHGQCVQKTCASEMPQCETCNADLTKCLSCHSSRFTGDNCDQCATGYTGTNCSHCASGYQQKGDKCVIRTCSGLFEYCASCNGDLSQCTKCKPGYAQTVAGRDCDKCADESNTHWPHCGGTSCDSVSPFDARAATCKDGVVQRCAWPILWDPGADGQCDVCDPNSGFMTINHSTSDEIYYTCGVVSKDPDNPHILEGCQSACEDGWNCTPTYGCSSCINEGQGPAPGKMIFKKDPVTGLCVDQGDPPDARCPSGFYPKGSSCAACTPIDDCEEGHLSCSSADNSQCSKCQSGFSPSAAGDICYKSCGAGEYYDEDECECEPCTPIDHCASGLACHAAGNSTCGACKHKFHLFANNTRCVQSCPDGKYYDDARHRCLPCTTIHHCSAAVCTTATDSTCSSCDSSYHKSADGTHCVKSCPVGKYYNVDSDHCVDCAAIHNCKKGSLTCSSAANSKCSACKGSLVPLSGGTSCGTKPKGREYSYADQFKALAKDAKQFCSWKAPGFGGDDPVTCGGRGGGACGTDCDKYFSFDADGTWNIKTTDFKGGSGPSRAFAYIGSRVAPKKNGTKNTLSFQFTAPAQIIYYIDLLFWKDPQKYFAITGAKPGPEGNGKCIGTPDKSAMYFNFFHTNDACGYTTDYLKIDTETTYNVITQFELTADGNQTVHVGVADANGKPLKAVTSETVGWGVDDTNGPHFGLYSYNLPSDSIETYSFRNLCINCDDFDSYSWPSAAELPQLR